METRRKVGSEARDKLREEESGVGGELRVGPLALQRGLHLGEEQRDVGVGGGRGQRQRGSQAEEGEGWWGPQGQNHLFAWQLTIHGWIIQQSVV